MNTSLPVTPANTIQRVLVVDEPGTDVEHLRSALKFAERHNAELMVMVAISPPSNITSLLTAAKISDGTMHEHLADAMHRLMTAKLNQHFAGHDIQLAIAVGKPHVEIIRAVVDHEVDVVVKLVEELEPSAVHVYASTDQQLLRKCPCKVWLRQPRSEMSSKHVLAAIDVDFDDAQEPETLRELNADILSAAMGWAGLLSSDVHVLHAWEPPSLAVIRSLFTGRDIEEEVHFQALDVSREKALADLVDNVRRSQPNNQANLHVHVRRGDPRRVIAQAVEELDVAILVMGTVARVGFEGVVIGNTAEDVQNSLARSLVAVKPAGFVSPMDLKRPS